MATEAAASPHYLHVIMPYGSDKRAGQKLNIIREAAGVFGLDMHFPFYMKERPKFDLNTALHDLKGSDFVLADLSLERPSCYYELGLAHGLGKRVYLIAQRGTDIHQTADRDSVCYYEDLKDLRRAVDNILKKSTATNAR